MNERESCNVADQHCEAAANHQYTYCVAECFRCGMPVCTKCSSKRKYMHFGTKRLCNNCQVEVDGNDKRVVYRIARQAGYNHKQSLHYAEKREYLSDERTSAGKAKSRDRKSKR